MQIKNLLEAMALLVSVHRGVCLLPICPLKGSQMRGHLNDCPKVFPYFFSPGHPLTTP